MVFGHSVWAFEAAPQISLTQRRQNIQDLHDLALQLRDQQIPGVTLWSRLLADVVQRYEPLAVDPAVRCDMIMQDLAVVILGPAALKYLTWFEALTPDAFEDPLVKQFFTDFEALGLPAITEPFVSDWRQSGYAGKLDEALDPGLDRHFANDFRPELNDHTDNQIFHSFFYQFMAYVTRADETVRAASIYHEVFDAGGSVEDHTAALLAIATGHVWRAQRDSSLALTSIHYWPAMIQMTYGKVGPDLLLGQDLHPDIKAFYERIEHLLADPDPWERLHRSAEYGLINGVVFFRSQKNNLQHVKIKKKPRG